jgi:hypothetical protein
MLSTLECWTCAADVPRACGVRAVGTCSCSAIPRSVRFQDVKMHGGYHFARRRAGEGHVENELGLGLSRANTRGRMFTERERERERRPRETSRWRSCDGTANGIARCRCRLSPSTVLACQQTLRVNSLVQCHMSSLVQCHMTSLVHCHMSSLVQCHMSSLVQCHMSSLVQCHMSSLVQCHMSSFV